jgi:hypothetical protein
MHWDRLISYLTGALNLMQPLMIFVIILERIKVPPRNDEFSTERNKRDNPSAKLMMINGLIVPIDILESESQEGEDEDNTMQDKRQKTMDNFI